ncbi:MAG: dehydrogenase [Candidatus Hydrogenedentota bacterium]
MTTPISRRIFLGAAATAAIAASTRTGKAAASDRIRVAAFGCKNRGGQVAADMQKSGQFDVVALCDCDESMFAEARKELAETDAKPALLNDFRKALDDSTVDAVIVAVPDHWHALMTCMALDAGKHVYCEKPMSYNIGDGQAICMAQDKHPDRVVHVGTQHRSGKHFQECRDFIRNGGLGKIAFCRAWMCQSRSALPPMEPSEPPTGFNYDLWVGPAPFRPYVENMTHYNWHWVIDFGTGEMGNWGVHWLDTARWILGVDLPDAVTSAAGQYVTRDAKQWPDTQTVMYEFPNLTMLWEQRLWTNVGVHGRKTGVEFSGEKGIVILERSGWEFIPREGEPVKHPGSDLMLGHVTNFAEAIRGQAKSIVPAREGHLSAALCHLGNIAAMTMNRLDVGDESNLLPNNPSAQTWLKRENREGWQS